MDVLNICYKNKLNDLCFIMGGFFCVFFSMFIRYFRVKYYYKKYWFWY